MESPTDMQPDEGGQSERRAAPASRDAQTYQGRELQRLRDREAHRDGGADAITAETTTGYGLLMQHDEARAVLLAVGIAALSIPAALLGAPVALVLIVLACVACWGELRRRPRTATVILPYVVGFLVVFQLLSGVILGVLGGLVVPIEELASEEAVLQPTAAWFVTVGAQLTALMAAALAFPRLQRRLRFEATPTLRTLGLRVSSSRIAGLGLGLLVGAAAVGALVAVLFVTGCVRIALSEVASATEQPAGVAFAGYLLLLLGIAVCEEISLRGFVLQNLGLYLGPTAAVVLSSLLTALLHAWNPHADSISLVSMFLLGTVLSLAYLATDSLWMSVGVHWAWNVTMGPVFGLSVSGLSFHGLLKGEVTPDHPFWTGGEFGPEGGLGVVICLAVVTLGLTALAGRRG